MEMNAVCIPFDPHPRAPPFPDIGAGGDKK
jgi:hypothetical protein